MNIKRNSITTKIVLLCIGFGVVASIGAWFLFRGTITEIKYEHVLQTERNECYFLQKHLGEGDWHVDGTRLYLGNTFLGDGSRANANIEPFEEFERLTGSLCYTMLRLPDGNYLRIAGSTRGADGDTIVGTLIEDYVSKSLDKNGEFYGPANVVGVQIYCYYKAVYNETSDKPLGCIVLGHNVSEIQEQVALLQRRYCFMMFGFIIIMILAFYGSLNGFRNSIIKIKDYLDRIGSGEFPKDTLHITSKDELGQVVDSVNSMVVSLKQHKDMCNDLNIAQRIQSSALPKVDFHSEHAEISASIHTAKEIGGDFYNYFQIDETHIALVVADAEGKGIPAAMLMMKAKTLIDSFLKIYLSPKKVLDAVNTALYENNETCTFVTIWLGICNLSTGELRIANAAHNNPFISYNGGKFEKLTGPHGFPAGATDDLALQEYTINLHNGDRIFLFTDGVTEAFNEDMKQFGETRLQQMLSEYSGDSSQELLLSIHDGLQLYRGNAARSDDETMLVFTYKS